MNSKMYITKLMREAKIDYLILMNIRQQTSIGDVKVEDYVLESREEDLAKIEEHFKFLNHLTQIAKQQTIQSTTVSEEIAKALVGVGLPEVDISEGLVLLGNFFLIIFGL